MSEEKTLEIIVDFFNALESACVNGRRMIAEVMKAAEKNTAPQVKDKIALPFDVSKIQWLDRENEKGKFQVSEDYDSADHKALLKFLTEHAGGCIQSKDSEGRPWFYWVYTSGSKIGRRLKVKAASR